MAFAGNFRNCESDDEDFDESDDESKKEVKLMNSYDLKKICKYFSKFGSILEK